VSLLYFLVLRKRNSPSLSRRERLLFRPEPGVELCLGVGEGMGFRGEVEGNLWGGQLPEFLLSNCQQVKTVCVSLFTVLLFTVCCSVDSVSQKGICVWLDMGEHTLLPPSQPCPVCHRLLSLCHLVVQKCIFRSVKFSRACKFLGRAITSSLTCTKSRCPPGPPSPSGPSRPRSRGSSGTS